MNIYVTMNHCNAHDMSVLREEVIRVLKTQKGQTDAYSHGVVDTLLSMLEEIDNMEKAHQQRDLLEAGKTVDRLHKENSVSGWQDIFGR